MCPKLRLTLKKRKEYGGNLAEENKLYGGEYNYFGTVSIKNGPIPMYKQEPAGQCGNTSYLYHDRNRIRIAVRI